MITFLANLVIPMFIFTLILYGTLKRKDIYTPFLEGVMDGFKIVFEIAPTLIALFFATCKYDKDTDSYKPLSKEDIEKSDNIKTAVFDDIRNMLLQVEPLAKDISKQ